MAHGLNAMLKRGGPSGGTLGGCKSDGKTTGIGSRRIFAPQFKLQVLDSYRNDADCKGNQRATARKYGIHRRQIQKWLQVEGNLRNSVLKSGNNNNITSSNNNNNATNNNVISNNVSANNNNIASVSGGVSELIVCPEATSGSRKCGLAVALRSGAESSRQQDDSSVVPVQSGSVRVTEIDVHQRNTTLAAGAGGVVVVAEDMGKHLAVDKRVPDIPHNNNNIYQQQQPQQYEWHHYQMRRSPDTASSTTGSCYSDLGDSSPALVACSDGQCDCTSSSAASSLSELCLPLDYTMHTRTSLHGDTRSATTTAAHSPPPPPPPQYPLVTSMCSPVPRTPSPPPPPCQCSAAPIDLTVRRRPQLAHSSSPTASYTIHTTLTPVPVIATVPPAPNTSPLPPPNATAHIWDLSTGRGGVKRAHDQDTTSTTAASAPNSLQERPVKLFKPYLDHVSDDECDMKRNQPPVIISSCHYDTEYFYNNNIGDYSVLYKDESNSGGGGGGTPYYCPLNDYYPNGGLQYISSSVAQDLVVHHSPFIFSKDNNNISAGSGGLNSIKQRQSYSLDFKLSAIECYYRDAVCRGNQRAVASKFKIHRRQVQKWLKQEHQLRQRNETMKPLHIVR